MQKRDNEKKCFGLQHLIQRIVLLEPQNLLIWEETEPVCSGYFSLLSDVQVGSQITDMQSYISTFSLFLTLCLPMLI